MKKVKTDPNDEHGEQAQNTEAHGPTVTTLIRPFQDLTLRATNHSDDQKKSEGLFDTISRQNPGYFEGPFDESGQHAFDSILLHKPEADKTSTALVEPFQPLTFKVLLNFEWVA